MSQLLRKVEFKWPHALVEPNRQLMYFWQGENIDSIAKREWNSRLKTFQRTSINLPEKALGVFSLRLVLRQSKAVFAHLNLSMFQDQLTQVIMTANIVTSDFHK